MRFLLTLIERSFYERYVDEMGLKGDEAVLEYGPGPGKMSKYLARALPRGRLVCVDVSRVWMGIVHKVLREYKNVDFKLGDISGLAIDDGSFDVLVVSFVLHDVDADERQNIMHTLVKKLKKGGKAFVREPDKQGHGMRVEEVRALMRISGLKEHTFEHFNKMLVGSGNKWIFEKA